MSKRQPILALALGMITAALLGACGGGGDDGASTATGEPLGENVAFERIAAGRDAGNVVKTYQVIRSDDELDTLWSTHLTTIWAPDFELPPIDFETQRLIAAFWGQAPSISVAIEVVSVDLREERAVATIRVDTLARNMGCGADAAVISPYDLVVVPKLDVPIEIRETIDDDDCSLTE